MNMERAQEFQEKMTKETVALLELIGDDADTSKWLHGISLIGTAWGIPTADTERRMGVITQARSQKGVYPEEELPINATGMETLDNIWDLFESATRLKTKEDRIALFQLATELAECHNLLDWIEKTPAEQELPVPAAGDTEQPAE